MGTPPRGLRFAALLLIVALLFATIPARSFAQAAVVSRPLVPAKAKPLGPSPGPDPWFAKDKVLHFTVSAALAGGAYGATSLLSDHLGTRAGCGAGAAILAGTGKELIDLAGYGDPSWKDFVWDLLGTTVGVTIALTIDLSARSAAAY